MIHEQHENRSLSPVLGDCRFYDNVFHKSEVTQKKEKKEAFSHSLG